MAYTVKELANLSGVSVRTLHFYDEIGLLKPAYHGRNGYRYYEESELLRLQQILFFRELDFELKQIQKILGRSDYNQIAALSTHRNVLKKQKERIHGLIKTIDKTIDHLKGVKNMSNQEMYQGFTNEKQAQYEKYLIDHWGDEGKKYIKESKKNTQDWTKSDYDRLKNDFDLVFKQIADAIKSNFKPDTPAVQNIIAKHYQIVKRVYHPTKESYIGLGQLYVEHPDFKDYFIPFQSQIPEFIAEAMKVYAQNNLN